jgi:hypothetical protein
MHRPKPPVAVCSLLACYKCAEREREKAASFSFLAITTSKKELPWSEHFLGFGVVVVVVVIILCCARAELITVKELL